MKRGVGGLVHPVLRGLLAAAHDEHTVGRLPIGLDGFWVQHLDDLTDDTSAIDVHEVAGRAERFLGVYQYSFVVGLADVLLSLDGSRV